MADTKIQWTNKTWNPVRGCSRVSTGCASCYAITQALRFSGPGQPYEGLVKRAPDNWTGLIRLVPEKLDEPLHWRKPSRIFVNSMSDLFHPDIPDDFLDQVFAVMMLSHQHTFQVLTKRPENIGPYFERLDRSRRLFWNGHAGYFAETVWPKLGIPRARWRDLVARYGVAHPTNLGDSTVGVWPLPNIWIGVSVEDQARADERIPLLLQTPAKVRFLSVEPLLGPVDLKPWLSELAWVIAGGESGHGARRCDLAWIRSVVAQCRDAGVPVFVKQLGSRAIDEPSGLVGKDTPFDLVPVVSRRLRDAKGGSMQEWPEDLRIRQFPTEDR